MDLSDYERNLLRFRDIEYPQLKEQIYLDHAGTTLYAKSVIERFSADLTSSLYGNPHSASSSSQLSTQKIEHTRHKILQFFNADPDSFDVVFVANATAAIKLVTDAFSQNERDFWYGYHKDAHTSLVGVRELAATSRCFASDSEVEQWIDTIPKTPTSSRDRSVCLFGYPAQSNMDGRRLPLEWCRKIREAGSGHYSLLDAAAFASTSPLDLSDPSSAPDFTAISFYKIFGFPDLGALLVRKGSADILVSRKYFGGGTVDMVVSLKEQWHAKKSTSVHSALEDGTLPFHNIIALSHAIEVHEKLYGSMTNIAKHVSRLTKQLVESMTSLKHMNGLPVCKLYSAESAQSYGPAVAFNLQDSRGSWMSNAEVEKLASVRNIHLRTGGLCNPGGIASALSLQPWEMHENFTAGHRCGSENDVIRGKATGVIRISLGAMSTTDDVIALISFLSEYFVEPESPAGAAQSSEPIETVGQGEFFVESLAIYPIKSCAGWKIAPSYDWDVRPEGLAWDREWCLVHETTGSALSQKQHARMALLRPSVDLEEGQLRVRFVGHFDACDMDPEISIPLSPDPNLFRDVSYGNQGPRVCGEAVKARVYKSPDIARFFSSALNVPCQLARFSANGAGTSQRHAKADLQQYQKVEGHDADRLDAGRARPILLSNESPILTISRCSLNRLNEEIKARGGKAALAEAFRANIVVAQDLGSAPGSEQAYAEDYWRVMQIGSQYYQILGSCRRCQMVCVDQETAQRNAEPFSSLAKTRRLHGKVWFGQHTCHLPTMGHSSASAQQPTIRVGDRVRPVEDGDEMSRVAGWSSW